MKLAPTKEPGTAAVESVTTAAKNGGIFKRDEYRIKDGAQGLYVTTVLRNETSKAKKVSTKSDFTRFENHGDVEGGVYYADAVDPADKAGYAKVNLSVTGAKTVGGDVEIAPGAEVVIQRFIAVGRSAAEAVGLALEAKGEKLGTLTGSLLDSAGKPASR